MMINHVPLESYLRGVVPHEVSTVLAAGGAQDAGLRGARLRARQPAAGPGPGTSTATSATRPTWASASRTRAPTPPSRGTAGVCPTYDGKPIVATYFSCSGGQTESVNYVWGGSYPYLKGVSDPYDSYGSLHDWGPLRRTPSQIGGPLGASGTVRAVYTLKRGDSPRIVKAAILGSTGTSFIDGGSLRMKLGLNSSWAIFTSMGISPAARDGASVTAGGSITLKGRLYPALADGAKVYLHSYYGGRLAQHRGRHGAHVREPARLLRGPLLGVQHRRQPVGDDQVLLLQPQGEVADHDHQGRLTGSVRAAARAW